MHPAPTFDDTSDYLQLRSGDPSAILHHSGEMGMVGRLNLSLKKQHALEFTRIAVGQQKLVYILIADKRVSYPHGGKSAIAYIGTTKNGIARVAQSAAWWAEEILGTHGIKKVIARIVTCGPRQKVKTWRKLERALLLEFRSAYGSVPKCNWVGKNMVETDEFSYFSRDAVRKIIQKLG